MLDTRYLCCRLIHGVAYCGELVREEDVILLQLFDAPVSTFCCLFSPANPRKCVLLPIFSPFTARFDPQFIEERKAGLHQFLDLVTHNPSLMYSRTLQLFLESPDFQCQ